jgi:hypothetical protein
MLEEFGRRLEELQGKVEKNNKNSSKPPSSDELKRRRRSPAIKRNGRLAACPGT